MSTKIPLDKGKPRVIEGRKAADPVMDRMAGLPKVGTPERMVSVSGSFLDQGQEEEDSMKTRSLLALAGLMCLSARAGAEDVTVWVWDPGCNHTTATSYFTLPPQQKSQRIYVDLSECSEEQMGTMLFFGNYVTKTSNRQLSSKHKVRLHMSALDSTGKVTQTMESDSGSVRADMSAGDSPGCWLEAENMNRKKEVRIRLRAQLLAP